MHRRQRLRARTAPRRGGARRSSVSSAAEPPDRRTRPVRGWAWRSCGHSPSVGAGRRRSPTVHTVEPVPRCAFARRRTAALYRALTWSWTRPYPAGPSIGSCSESAHPATSLLAIAGLALAVGVGLAANAVSEDSIGLSARAARHPGGARAAPGERNGPAPCRPPPRGPPAGGRAGRAVSASSAAGRRRPRLHLRPRRSARPRRRSSPRPRPSRVTTTAATAAARSRGRSGDSDDSAGSDDDSGSDDSGGGDSDDSGSDDSDDEHESDD